MPSPARETRPAGLPAAERALQWTLGLAAGATSLAVFSRLVFFVPKAFGISDFTLHVAYARALCQGSAAPQPHFLFELLICALAAPVGRPWAFGAAAVAVATAAVVAKVILTYRRVREAGGAAAAFCAALCLLFAMPLFNWWKFPDTYLGQVSPNVWHNPTTVAVLPLAFLLFHAAARLTVTDPPRAAAGAGALVLLNCLTKPNYVLALLPCWLILLADRARRALLARQVCWLRPALIGAAVAGPAGVVLLWQASRLGAAGAGVTLAPLAVWRIYSPHIVASILLSVAFPLAVLGLYFREARAARTAWSEAPLLLAWSVLVVAVLQMALLAEAGPRFEHGNFFWASYTANYLLFVESAVVVAAAPRSGRWIIAWGLLFAHALVGVVYAFRLAAGWAIL